jgi:hypothetical protein
MPVFDLIVDLTYVNPEGRPFALRQTLGFRGTVEPDQLVACQQTSRPNKETLGGIRPEDDSYLQRGRRRDFSPQSNPDNRVQSTYAQYSRKRR